jgi:hypothetical protein
MKRVNCGCCSLCLCSTVGFGTTLCNSLPYGTYHNIYAYIIIVGSHHYIRVKYGTTYFTYIVTQHQEPKYVYATIHTILEGESMYE